MTTMNRTFEERRADSLDGLRKLRRDLLPDPETGVAHTERVWGATGSFTVDFVLADIWSRPQLSRRDRSMIVLATLIALGQTGKEMVVHTQGAIHHGMTREEVEEVVTHVSAYVGFPKTLGAIRIVQDGLRSFEENGKLPPHEPAARKSDEERYHDGLDVLRTLMDWSDPAGEAPKLEERLGPIGPLAIRYLFGEVWARTQLSRRDRSLITVAILTALGRTDQMTTHVPGALNHGVTREEIEEAMVQMLGYAGWPAAVSGLAKAREIFAAIDAESSE